MTRVPSALPPARRLCAAACLFAVPLLAEAGTFTDWHLNGDASLLDGDATLRVAPLGSFRTGSAWAPTELSLLDDFSVSFSFRVSGGSGADGFTLSFQSSADGSAAIGDSGGGLGYQGIGRSVAFIYDTFDNGFDTDREPGDNTSVTTEGDLVNGWGGLEVGDPIGVNGGSLRGQVLFSWIDYDASLGQFTMFLNDVDSRPGAPSGNIMADWQPLLGARAWVGFTAATGALDDNHDILSFSVTPSPVPLPAAAWLFGAGMLGVARRRV